MDDKRWVPLDDVIADADEGTDDVHAALVLAVRAHGAVGVIPEMGVGEVGYFHSSEGDCGALCGTRTFSGSVSSTTRAPRSRTSLTLF